MILYWKIGCTLSLYSIEILPLIHCIMLEKSKNFHRKWKKNRKWNKKRTQKSEMQKTKWKKCILCIFERVVVVVVVVFTFLPSISCVPWAKTLSTLAGSLNVMNPNPLKWKMRKKKERDRKKSKVSFVSENKVFECNVNIIIYCVNIQIPTVSKKQKNSTNVKSHGIKSLKKYINRD